MKQSSLNKVEIVKPPDLPSLVADKLQTMIVNQEFRVGDRLPSERDLAAMLGVSRNVIREAAKLLQERGLVSVQSGSGVYVTAVPLSVFTKSVDLYVRQQQVSIAQLYEVRWLLEIGTVRLAAMRGSDSDLAALEACIQKSHEFVQQPTMFSALDVEFHVQLAAASGNPILPMLLETITDALQAQCRLTERMQGAQENALKHHLNIFHAIKAKDAAAARRAMEEHLKSSWEWLRQAVENPDDEIGAMSFPM